MLFSGRQRDRVLIGERVKPSSVEPCRGGILWAPCVRFRECLVTRLRTLQPGVQAFRTVVPC